MPVLPFPLPNRKLAHSFGIAFYCRDIYWISLMNIPNYTYQLSTFICDCSYGSGLLSFTVLLNR